MEGGVINSFVSTSISGSTFFENYSDNHGGVMTVRDAPLTVSNSKFTSNYSLDGGAINVRHSGDCCNVTISGSTFTNNFGFRFITRGGAIYIERGWASSSIVRITDSYFDNNRASTWRRFVFPQGRYDHRAKLVSQQHRARFRSGNLSRCARQPGHHADCQ